MNYAMHILSIFIFIGFHFSCSNAATEPSKESVSMVLKNQDSVDTGSHSNSVINEKLIEVEQQANELAHQEAIVLAEKEANEFADKKAKELADKKAKLIADKQALELAELKAKQESEQKAKEQAEQKAKTLAKQRTKDIEKELAKQKAEQKAKQDADKNARDQAEKLTQESIDKETKVVTEQQAIQQAESIIQKVDKNMVSKTQISTTEMIIHGRRNSRTIRLKGYTQGDEQSFSEYLSPAKEKGTKMLKLNDRLWIYSPDTDRSIQLSGHMLKQSVMGSDLSYEDMMEDRKLTEMYHAKLTDEETIDDRACWVLELNAKVDDASYEKRKMWVDKTRYVPLKEELYAKSGQLLKKTVMKDIQKIDGRWYPKKMNFKDMLKSGEGTDFVILEIEFDVNIPAHIFSKASLKK